MGDIGGVAHQDVVFLPLTTAPSAHEPEQVIGCLALLRRERPLPDTSAVAFARTIGTAYAALVTTRSA